MSAPRQGLGTETIPQLGINETIPEHITPDVRILSSRFGQRARLIGYRSDEVFHIIWIDPKHKVYQG